ncbi:putative oxidoreductase [Streptoalloteichus tenebrarius]|uniref:Oxidoreductase n=1 Tax=Streptoalloteichus tenebrarius (strain ATCC 17920 / DSM 40477 / JCM 4838 / CBS 697.72 / NBRC 16177 / NCIMB 11028 / NRRL B-12390 / A12253. 1 / ISP 5477) TaxID=1933 RepID=A0ABT1HSZ3_STRSD|nr:DoxX family protein [Streptoalloteichus tenebrarius]MCP2258643.1 putative oxidoreductase [Streptoalloteichus tenebrarius]BFF02788.1 DoxX family protein [Streptoalloteichus tenebrarius]
MQLPAWIRDLVLLLARVAVGVVFMAHGWQKLVTNGMGPTSTAFGQMGIPVPTLSAWFTALVEFAGGAALIVGFLLPLVGLLQAFAMLGALFMVHLNGGLFLPKGFEYVLVLAAAALALGFNGGAYSLDRVLFGRRRAVSRAQEPAVA